MAIKEWTVDSHTVALDWSYFRGGRKVLVDGEVIDKSMIPFRWKSTQRFDLSGREAVLTTKPIKPISAYFDVTLTVDGKKVEATSQPGFWDV